MAMMNFDQELFFNTYNWLIAEKSFKEIFHQVFIPLMTELGLLWQTDTITPAHENFIDEQRFGPYLLWHHKHFFEPMGNVTKMTDLVHYALPFGFLGRIMNAFVVRNKLKAIFDHRRIKVEELFNAK
jgi:ligand-binding SRPBCC domain-containing protein